MNNGGVPHVRAPDPMQSTYEAKQKKQKEYNEAFANKTIREGYRIETFISDDGITAVFIKGGDDTSAAKYIFATKEIKTARGYVKPEELRKIKEVLDELTIKGGGRRRKAKKTRARKTKSKRRITKKRN